MPLNKPHYTSNNKVSVLMPVYNAAPYLVASVASIIEQDFRDWELICVNDGSRDGSLQILERFAKIDPRVRVIDQPNRGIVSALQCAIAESSGELLARMDADDISVSSRFGKQVDYLQKHPDVVVVGGAALEIDADGDPLRITRHPNDSQQLVHRLLTRQSALIHPSVMMRRDAVLKAGGYRPKYQWIEDHDLWLRLSKLGKLANIDSVLLGYRQHATSVCWQRSNTQRELMNELLQEAYAERNLPCPDEVLMDSVKARSQGGPGKWTRMALRGGHTQTAKKHLKALWRSDDSWRYKCRMTLEFALRYSTAATQRQPETAANVLPDLSSWRSRIAA
jgi:glycosyltransferase involved in cell wall biosynthesis